MKKLSDKSREYVAFGMSASDFPYPECMKFQYNDHLTIMSYPSSCSYLAAHHICPCGTQCLTKGREMGIVTSLKYSLPPRKMTRLASMFPCWSESEEVVARVGISGTSDRSLTMGYGLSGPFEEFCLSQSLEFFRGGTLQDGTIMAMNNLSHGADMRNHPSSRERPHPRPPPSPRT